jgi:hypothetical protein
MTPKKYAYCKIFVNDPSPDEIATRVARALGTPAANRVIEQSGLIVEVRRNIGTGGHRDFLEWPVTVEIECADGSSSSPMVPVVDRILRYLWSTETPSVAACPFEDELPWGGGMELLAE